MFLLSVFLGGGIDVIDMIDMIDLIEGGEGI